MEILLVISSDIFYGDVVAINYQSVEQGFKLPSGDFKSLKVLDLNFSEIGYYGSKMIAEGLNVNHRLTCLNLRCCRIGASGVNALMTATCVLKRLDLSLNDIGDEGARAVARILENSTSLQAICLSHCCIGPDGVEALTDALTCDTAVYLNWRRYNGNEFILSERSLYLFFLNHEKNQISMYFRNVGKSDRLYLNISCNKRISFEDGTGFALLDHFKKLVGLDLSGSNHCPYEPIKMVDYVLHKDNCKVPQSLDLSDDFPQDIANCIILKLLNHDKLQQIYFSAALVSRTQHFLADHEFKYEEVMALARGIQEKQDFNYSQNYYPVQDIDIPRTMMTMEESLAVLGALKHCNRIRNISFCLMTTTIQHQLSQRTRLSRIYILEHWRLK